MRLRQVPGLVSGNLGGLLIASAVTHYLLFAVNLHHHIQGRLPSRRISVIVQSQVLSKLMRG